MINTLRIALRGISAYRNLCESELVREMGRLLDALAAGQGEQAAERYAQVFYRLRQEGCSGPGEWLDEHLRYDEGPYPLLVERGQRDPALEQAARRDVETFALLAGLDCDKTHRGHEGPAAGGVPGHALQPAPVEGGSRPIYL